MMFITEMIPQYTVSTQIERQSQLERQETLFGCTVVSFGEWLSKTKVIYGRYFVEKYHCAQQKCPKF